MRVNFGQFSGEVMTFKLLIIMGLCRNYNSQKEAKKGIHMVAYISI
jgi:hypothetical protein